MKMPSNMQMWIKKGLKFLIDHDHHYRDDNDDGVFIIFLWMNAKLDLSF